MQPPRIRQTSMVKETRKRSPTRGEMFRSETITVYTTWTLVFRMYLFYATGNQAVGKLNTTLHDMAVYAGVSAPAG
jgi:hypothetical protein